MANERYLLLRNVGRGKGSCRKLLHPEIETPDEIAEVAAGEAKQFVMSRDVGAIYYPAANHGIITVGFHSVGTFTVE